ncbi:unnamed protein product [Didymodactylos carnosus]|uniref:Allantoate amidinohydrolase n=1 Tax=Didymodactylos carnosus TaxID=1234261 RepID=A0A815B678_9BILA|nr:unnamed protein product [Didymodactylos carnosus]CAF1263494.1 unnamed protein product [Didymodactylos carnosus]CAF3931891.1 unnamed protein product [Didymodactylos carnosus]CAF4043270.1 unnamed protein product [Didymodactylos carnosus]
MLQAERDNNLDPSTFAGSIDLVSEKLGGKVINASDEFFAEKENLLKPGRGVFIPDKYTDRGKWMDGWETRRKRVEGYDWCIIKLPYLGIIRGVDIDTNHFLGNHPPYASIDVTYLANEDEFIDQANWTEVLPKSSLKQGSQNIFSIQSQEKCTYIRLNIYPDGGVARFRAYGHIVKDWSKLQANKEIIDLAAIENGGQVIAANDMFFGNKDNLIMPGRGVNMGDGWETRRKRGPGNDWVIIKLAKPGNLKKIEIDTAHYKGNYPDRCWLDGCYETSLDINNLNWHKVKWNMILNETKLYADKQHYFEEEIIDHEQVFTHVRLNIIPDGGVGRLRLHGMVILNDKKKQ